MPDALGRWEPFIPEQVTEVFAGFDEPWWISGGWAIDLFLGHLTREHADIDVEIPRDSADRLPDLLRGWDLQLASSGVLRTWDVGSPIPGEINSLWCRPTRDDPWRLQIMLTTVEDGLWYYRRDRRIRRKLAGVVLRNGDGPPYVAPEIQLLFKAKGTRAKDELDFAAVAPLMSAEQREWLREALSLVSPGHPWVDRLQCRLDVSR